MHLVERVFPSVPVRQWLLSVPKQVRYHLVRKRKLRKKVREIFMDEVFKDVRRRAGVTRKAQGGAVTVEPRFGSALNLNLHLHSAVLDGVYVEDLRAGGLKFVEARPPTDEEVQALAERVRDRIRRLFEREGIELDGASGESEEPELFDAIRAASIRDLIALSDPLRRVTAVGKRESWEVPEKKCCGQADGYSVHANVRIEADDRDGLEQLLRSLLRPPYASERFREREDGKIEYELRRPRDDGSTHLILEPLDLLEKLAALIPPPREHGLTYHGILAPHAKKRGEVTRSSRAAPDDNGDPGVSRADWAILLKRTFGDEVLWCPRCGHRLKVIACITDAETAREILEAMGEWRTPPALAPPVESSSSLLSE